MTEKKSKLATVIVITGLLAGTLDILAAVIRYTIRTGNSPVRLLEFIASAVFGREEAFSGNTMMGVWGLTFHYLIAFTWTVIFFLAYPRTRLLRGNKFITAIAYGAVIWLIMNLIVLPLSRIPAAPFDLKQVIIGALILMAFVGLPISIMANRYYSGK